MAEVFLLKGLRVSGKMLTFAAFSQTQQYMLGAIIGDIVGSIYEFANIKTKQFPLFSDGMEFTDDSILTVATASWLLHGGSVADSYVSFGSRYPSPMGGYGTSFKAWLIRASRTGDAQPYGSCGNGSAMRVSPVGWAARTEQEVLALAEESAACTHNHPEGIKGAQATALCIFLARHGREAAEIRREIERRFGYDLSLSVGDIRPRYSWRGMDGTGNGGVCQDSVPQAIVCALEATDFEDAIRNAVSIGGDSDTIGCITGGIAEALFGVPAAIRERAMTYLTDDLAAVVDEFERRYGNGPLATDIAELSPRDFQQAFQHDPRAFLLDVRTPEEYDAGHLQGAALADWLDEAAFRKEMAGFDRRHTYYIYCRSGRRSHLAAALMLEQGFRVADMLGGILAWTEDGLPTVTD